MYASNQTVDETFYIKEIKEGKANQGKGKPYLSLTLCNKEGEIEAKYWDMDLIRANCRQGDYASIKGQTNLFNNVAQLTIYQLHKTDPVDLMRESLLSAEILQQKTSSLIEQYVPAQSLSAKLWQRFVSNAELYEKYCNAPAAISFHSNCKRGLWEHSVKVAEFVAPLLAVEEKGIGVVTSLLHDIGKCRSIFWQGPAPTMTTTGKLLDHIVLGVIELMPLLEEFPEQYKSLFLNGIVSHHGRLEWGSPVLPKTKFAALIHQADMLDSRAQHLEQLGEWEGWSPYDRMLGSEIYSAGGEIL